MKLSEHFTLLEATTSQTAAYLGIDNTPSAAMEVELMETAAFMEEVREVLGGKPILVTSWYRCPDLERAVAKIKEGAPLTGHHPLGAAVDFICPGFGTPIEVCNHLTRYLEQLKIGQLINEYDRWTHISRLSVPNPINRVLTIDGLGVRSGIHRSRVAQN